MKKKTILISVILVALLAITGLYFTDIIHFDADSSGTGKTFRLRFGKPDSAKTDTVVKFKMNL